MRRFPVSSVGPGYTSVWHRDPAGRWVIYQDQGPRFTDPSTLSSATTPSRSLSSAAPRGSLLRAGRLRLVGTALSRQGFFADLRRIWLIEDSTAAIDGVDLGESGSLQEQAHLGDLRVPQRGLFAIGSSFFELYDPARHHQVASRRELPGAGTPRDAV
jgi:hypothetical protein